jgi:hypothetical protein
MNTYNNNYIKHTPDFVYTPASQLFNNDEKPKNTMDTYICKFKTAFYGALLFVLLSLPIAYKILDMFGKLISNNVELYDAEYDDPLPLGRVIMSVIVGIILFIL